MKVELHFHDSKSLDKIVLKLPLKDGTIIDYVFVRDYEFNAPSAASAVVLGRSSNGNIVWKTEDGKLLKDL